MNDCAIEERIARVKSDQLYAERQAQAALQRASMAAAEADRHRRAAALYQADADARRSELVALERQHAEAKRNEEVGHG